MRYALLFAMFAGLVDGHKALADVKDDLARARFQEGHETFCGAAPSSFFAKPERFDLMVPNDFGQKRPVILWQFRCSSINPRAVFVIDGPYGGPEVAQLARPDLSVFDDQQMILGFSASPVAYQPQFDPQTLILGTHHADGSRDEAFEEARYLLTPDHFRLIHYAVDDIYDGVQTPVTVYQAP